MTDIMKFIKEERKKQGISQAKVAHAILVHPATLSNWEKYKFIPRFEDIERMLNFLGYEIIIRKKVQNE